MRQPDILGNPFDFAALVEDVGYPTVVFGQLRIDRRAGWMRVLSRLTPGERRALLRLPAFRRHLVVATPNARARLRQWFHDETSLPPLSVAERRAWIQDRVNLFGDEDFSPIIVAALMGLPDYIVDSVIPEVAFIGVGRNSTGWFSSSAFIHPEGHRLPHTIVLGPTSDVLIALHEIGHAWHAPSATRDAVAITVQGHEGLYQIAAAQGWSHRVDAHQRREERLAWGFAYAFL
jgi:hypothetical protein